MKGTMWLDCSCFSDRHLLHSGHFYFGESIHFHFGTTHRFKESNAAFAGLKSVASRGTSRLNIRHRMTLGNPEAVKPLNGRDTLLCVFDGKSKTDAQHRVSTRSGLCAQPHCFWTARTERGLPCARKGSQTSQNARYLRHPEFVNRVIRGLFRIGYPVIETAAEFL